MHNIGNKQSIMTL